MKKCKRILLVIMTCLILLPTTTYAGNFPSDLESTDEFIISPRFSAIHIFRGSITVHSSYVDVEGLLHATVGDKTKLVANLQKYDGGRWVTVKTLSTTSSGTLCSMDEKVYTSTGYKFRVKLYGYVYSGGRLLESTSIIVNE